MKQPPPDLVPIAEVARPHGIKGELRLKVYNPDTTLLGKGRNVFVQLTGTRVEDAVARVFSAVRPIEGGVLVRFAGVDDREGAEALRGASILVDRDELPELDAGEFYARDVEGARAELVSGEVIGTVKSLRSYPTCDVLVVETHEGATLEFPLVDDYVDEVDVEAHVVRLKTREGM